MREREREFPLYLQRASDRKSQRIPNAHRSREAAELLAVTFRCFFWHGRAWNLVTRCRGFGRTQAVASVEAITSHHCSHQTPTWKLWTQQQCAAISTETTVISVSWVGVMVMHFWYKLSSPTQCRGPSCWCTHDASYPIEPRASSRGLLTRWVVWLSDSAWLVISSCLSPLRYQDHKSCVLDVSTVNQLINHLLSVEGFFGCFQLKLIVTYKIKILLKKIKNKWWRWDLHILIGG